MKICHCIKLAKLIRMMKHITGKLGMLREENTAESIGIQAKLSPHKNIYSGIKQLKSQADETKGSGAKDKHMYQVGGR